jgi:hypothetical protein
MAKWLIKERNGVCLLWLTSAGQPALLRSNKLANVGELLGQGCDKAVML